MSIEVRRLVTGYDSDGNHVVSRDEVLAAGNRGPAGVSQVLWTVPMALPVNVDDEGQHPYATSVKWFLVNVPPDRDRGAAANDLEPGILHEDDTIDLILILSGEIWLELDGREEWTSLKAGDTLVQRATNHAWHNLTDETATFVTTIFPGLRTDATPSRAAADDHDLSRPVSATPPKRGD